MSDDATPPGGADGPGNADGPVVMDDFALVAAWRSGDQVAGNELVKRHFRTVYRFFRSKVDTDIDDLVQRTFLGLVKALPGFEGRATFKTFLLGVARHQLLQYLRSRVRARGKEAAEISVGDLVVDVSIDRLIAGSEEHRVLLQALRRLPVDLQLTIELFYWERMGVDEVGGVLEIPPGTVKSRLARARDGLRKILETMDIDPSLRESTIGDLDGWARSMRDLIDSGDPEPTPG